MARVYSATERRPVEGVLHPGIMLTREGVWACAGMSRDRLNKAVASGIVNPIEVDGRNWYESDELIKYIRSHKKQ